MASAFESEMTDLIDISPRLDAQSAVWPGDVAFSRAVALDVHAGHNITLSSVTTTVHVGAHADAPSHYHADGVAIDRVSLDAYLGPCMVLTVKVKNGAARLITPEDCAPALAAGAQRILFRTLSQPDPSQFNTDFMAFAGEAIETMGRAGVVLVGIDTPSVDPFESKDLPAHQALFRHGMRNLEGLVLAHVTDGSYELIALPLRIVGADASPVRAVLRRY